MHVAPEAIQIGGSVSGVMPNFLEALIGLMLLFLGPVKGNNFSPARHTWLILAL